MIAVAIWLVVSVLWANFFQDGFCNAPQRGEVHHSIACKFQLKGLLISLHDFKARTGKYPSHLKEMVPIELHRVPVCPTNISYEEGYSSSGENFSLRCTRKPDLVFTAKDIADLK